MPEEFLTYAYQTKTRGCGYPLTSDIPKYLLQGRTFRHPSEDRSYTFWGFDSATDLETFKRHFFGALLESERGD